jgi:hypothetical protein
MARRKSVPLNRRNATRRSSPPKPPGGPPPTVAKLEAELCAILDKMEDARRAMLAAPPVEPVFEVLRIADVQALPLKPDTADPTTKRMREIGRLLGEQQTSDGMSALAHRVAGQNPWHAGWRFDAVDRAFNNAVTTDGERWVS